MNVSFQWINVSLRASIVPLYPASIHCTCSTKIHHSCGSGFVVVRRANLAVTDDEDSVRLLEMDESLSCRRRGGFHLIVGQ